MISLAACACSCQPARRSRRPRRHGRCRLELLDLLATAPPAGAGAGTRRGPRAPRTPRRRCRRGGSRRSARCRASARSRSAPWCDRSRSCPSVARPIAPNSCTDTLMIPDASPASRCGRVGHAHRQQRQERRAGTETEHEEGEEQPREVARVHARVWRAAAARRRSRCSPAARVLSAPKRPTSRADTPIDITAIENGQRQEREARVDRVVAEHALEVQRAEEERGEHAR